MANPSLPPKLIPVANYTVQGDENQFTFKFVVESNEDLYVYVNGLEVSRNFYTVTGIGSDSGGEVTIDKQQQPLSPGDTVTLSRFTLPEQLTTFLRAGDFTADAVNAEFARLYALMQEQRRDLDSAEGVSSDLQEQITENDKKRQDGDKALQSQVNTNKEKIETLGGYYGASNPVKQWVEGATTSSPFQRFYFPDETPGEKSYTWNAPLASTGNVITLGESPVGDSNWQQWDLSYFDLYEVAPKPWMEGEVNEAWQRRIYQPKDESGTNVGAEVVLISRIDAEMKAEPDDNFVFSEYTSIAKYKVYAGESLNELVMELSKSKLAYIKPEDYNINQLPVVTIELQSGYVMDEQLLVQGVSLGWLAITSIDPIVTIKRSALINSISGRYPAFGARLMGELPVIAALFEMDSSGDGSEFPDGIPDGKTYEQINIVRDGVFTTTSNSFIAVNCGVRNAAGRGYHAANGGIAQAGAADFSGASQAVARVSNGTIANLRDFKGTDGKHNGLQLTNAVVSMPRADFSRSAYCGLFAQASMVLAQDAVFDGCQSADVNAGYDGAIYSDQASNINLAGGSAKNSGRVCLEAYASKIVLFDKKSGRIFNGSGAAEDAIIESSSIIIGNDSDFSSPGGMVLRSTDAVEVNLTSAILSDAGGGVADIKGGNCTLRGANCEGPATVGVFVSRNATVCLDDANLKGHSNAINGDGDCDVSAIGVDITNCGNAAVVANSSARINIRASKAAGSKATVTNGGEIDAYQSDVEMSQTPNRQMPAGLIKSEKVTYNKGSSVMSPSESSITIQSGINSAFQVSNEDIAVTAGGDLSGNTFFVTVGSNNEFSINLSGDLSHSGIRFNWQVSI